MSKLKEFSRRRFLRGAGKLILPLPFLECFLNTNGNAWASGTSFNPVYLYALNGLSTGSGWENVAELHADKSGYKQTEWNYYYPDKFGANYTIPSVNEAYSKNLGSVLPLTPFNDVRGDMNIFTNLWIGRGDGSEGAFANIAKNFASHHTVALHGILSGDGKYNGRVSDGKFTGYIRPQNTTTSDHLVYDKLGKNGKLLSFHVEKEQHGSGHGKALSWKNSKDELPERDLTNAYNNMFSGVTPGINDAAKQKAILEQSSVIDLMLEDYNSIKRSISSADRITVETHFEKILQLKKEIETEVKIDEAICQIPNKPSINYTTGKTAYGDEEARARIFNKLITMAAACGVSHVFTYGITHSRSGLYIEHFEGISEPNYTYGNERRDAHGNTHTLKLGEKGNVRAFKQFHSWQNSVYADLIKNFKAIKIGDDTMLDYSNLLYFVEAGHGFDFEQENSAGLSPHSTTNMVAFNAGGKKLGMKLGQHIDGKKRHPMAVATTAMKAMKISSPKIGEVDTIIPEILS